MITLAMAPPPRFDASILPQAKFSSDSYGHGGVVFLIIGFSGSEAAEVLISAIYHLFLALQKSYDLIFI